MSKLDQIRNSLRKQHQEEKDREQARQTRTPDPNPLLADIISIIGMLKEEGEKRFSTRRINNTLIDLGVNRNGLINRIVDALDDLGIKTTIPGLAGRMNGSLHWEWRIPAELPEQDGGFVTKQASYPEVQS